MVKTYHWDSKLIHVSFHVSHCLSEFGRLDLSNERWRYNSFIKRKNSMSSSVICLNAFLIDDNWWGIWMNAKNWELTKAFLVRGYSYNSFGPRFMPSFGMFLARLQGLVCGLAASAVSPNWFPSLLVWMVVNERNNSDVGWPQLELEHGQRPVLVWKR